YQLTLHTNDVPHVQLIPEAVGLRAHPVLPQVELDGAAPVLKVPEAHLAMDAPGHEPAGHPAPASGQPVKISHEFGDLVGARKSAPVGLHTPRPQAFQLGQPVLVQPQELRVAVLPTDHVRRRRHPLARPAGLPARPVHGHSFKTSRISSWMVPSGTFTVTTVPARWPIKAFPTGDSLEIRFSVGSASAEPTTRYSISSPSSRPRRPKPPPPASASSRLPTRARRRVFSGRQCGPR